MACHKPSAILFGISVFFLIAGIVLLVCTPSIIHMLLEQRLPFSNGSLSYKIWKDIPIPIYQRIYFFNVTNPDDFLLKGAKPNVEEIGPYTYRSSWRKHNISWFENSTVSYREVKQYFFVRNLSVGGEDDIITSINAPMVVAATLFKNSSVDIKLGINFLFWILGEKFFIKKTVKELTYTGYRDIIMLLAPFIDPKIPNRNGYFSWLYGKNDTDDGLYNVFTGHSGLDKFNIISTRNYKTTFDVWKTKSCAMFNGSNGEISPPLSNGQTTIHVFQTDICRSWPLTYKENSEILNIPAKRFTAEAAVLQNGTDNSDNACYNLGMNLPSGAMDISPCQFGAPAVLSYPHFYLADPVYQEAVNGLSPKASKHRSYIDVEPTTGISINAAVRAQANFYVEKIEGIWPFNKLKSSLVFPVLWQELTFYINENLAEKFDAMVVKPQLYAKISSFLAIGLGILLALSALIVFIIVYRKKKLKDDDDDPPLYCDDSDDLYGQTNEIIKENGGIENHVVDDEERIRDV